MARLMLGVPPLLVVVLCGCAGQAPSARPTTPPAPPTATSSPVACTAAGAVSGVEVSFEGRPADRTPFTACVAGECRSSRVLWVGASPAPGPVFVEHPAIASTTPVRIDLHGAKVGERPLYSATVTPRVVEPNGPRCPPRAYHADVTVPSGVLGR